MEEALLSYQCSIASGSVQLLMEALLLWLVVVVHVGLILQAILVFLAGNLMQLQAHWQLARLSRPVVIPGPDEAPGPAKNGPGSQQQPRFRGDKPRRAAGNGLEGPAALSRVADPGPYRLPAGEHFCLLCRLGIGQSSPCRCPSSHAAPDLAENHCLDSP